MAERALDLRTHFGDFGTDVANLKKRLRALGAQLHDTFPAYAGTFCRLFGIDHEQALSLFQQTVSMKSVGDLTEFVRDHMLEAFDVQPRIDRLLAHFDDLTRAHEAVLKAKTQVERLTPIVATCDAHAREAAVRDELTDSRAAVRPWLAERESALLVTHLASLEGGARRLDEEARRLKGVHTQQQVDRDALRDAIRANGGDQLETLRERLRQSADERDARAARAERYGQLVRGLGLPDAGHLEAFLSNEKRARELGAEWHRRLADVRNDEVAATVAFAAERSEIERLEAEVRALEQRRSNIPAQKLQIRGRLCAALGLDETVLPFAGELLQVRDDDRTWEGAVERVLNPFGTSMLVADEHYAAVAAWVNATHLGDRFVYLHVVGDRRPLQRVPAADSLVDKLEVREGTPFAPWLRRHLVEHFDHVCCEGLDQFRRERFALTKSGQIRTGDRHVKDDRRRVDDAREYVLGWRNEAKLAALRASLGEHGTRARELATRVETLHRERERLGASVSTLKAFAEYPSFTDLDWRSSARDIALLEERRRELEAASNQLKELERQLVALAAALEETSAAQQGVAQDRRTNDERQHGARVRLERAARARDGVTLTDVVRQRLDALLDEPPGPLTLALDTVADVERTLVERLTGRIEKQQRKLTEHASEAARRMSDYKRDYPVETQEVDAVVDAAGEYRALLERLRTDALPTFERRFKQLLNENAIIEVASFNAALRSERREILDRIFRINESLHRIEYNEGRYIRLEAERSQDAENRQFQEDLRACTEGAIGAGDDEAYSEQKFLAVKRLLERFRGREQSSELDRRWTRKVTDVRTWFTFAASERWRESDVEHERYSDSSGKSGGQKEKLAYTILAASLAYQFGIDEGARRRPTFRFVVIDEAFGRGSDESARFGLKLFRELGLQLLIVTPLQKIHIIEPFVSSVGFVANRDGQNSTLRHITIEEYRAEAAARATR